jgi:hypothetical protein
MENVDWTSDVEQMILKTQFLSKYFSFYGESC